MWRLGRVFLIVAWCLALPACSAPSEDKTSKPQVRIESPQDRAEVGLSEIVRGKGTNLDRKERIEWVWI